MEQLQIPEILKQYFTNPNSVICETLKTGLANFNYKLTDKYGKLFFLKIFRNANLLRIESVAALLKNLLDYRFPTPEIIPDLCGNYFWTNGEQGAIMTRFIRGKYPENKEENLYHIGNITAALHQIPLRDGLLQGFSLNFETLLYQIYNFESAMEDDLEKFLVEINPVIKNIPSTGFPQSIIHGDIFLDNLILTNLGDLYFVDFEGGCVDQSIFDLARSVIGCAIINRKIDLQLTKALLSGYSAVKSFEPIEQEFLYEFIIYAGAISTMWRYVEFHIRRPLENKKMIYKDLLAPTLDFFRNGKKAFDDVIYSSKI